MQQSPEITPPKPLGRTARAFGGYIVLVLVIAAANAIYGGICDSRCESQCKEKGFDMAYLAIESGFWSRIPQAFKGEHGTCGCARSTDYAGALMRRPAIEFPLSF